MYHIPAGTHCSIAKDDDRRAWREWWTTQDLWFDEPRTELSGAMTFERDGWLLLIKSKKVSRPPHAPSRPR